ncbi:MAG: tetratricopeptide repeat protein [Nitrospirales bacterium]
MGRKPMKLGTLYRSAGRGVKSAGLPLVLLGLLVASPALAGTPVQAPANGAYPQSLPVELATLLDQGAAKSSDPAVLLRVAKLSLDMGDDLFTDRAARLEAYERGATYARQAMDGGAETAQAHFLYAANAGSAANLKGLVASAFIINDIKYHMKKCLHLQPDHAPALHMMGMMLEELPWVLGGDPAAALDHLQRAVQVDPAYAHARLDLARAYLKRGMKERARKELQIITGMTRSRAPYAWAQRYRPEAERLLSDLGGD